MFAHLLRPSQQVQELPGHLGATLRQTNVSNPSIVEHKPSLHSVTASEDYYSLSSHSSEGTVQGLGLGAGEAGRSTHTIQRFQTPPSRYRTPAQSRTDLPVAEVDAAAHEQDTRGEEEEEEDGAQEARKTPMRGQGRRRASNPTTMEYGVGVGAESSTAAVLREGGVRRKPVPSTVMEARESGGSQGYDGAYESGAYRASQIDPTRARSSVAMDLEREEQSPPTPGVDDTPYIRFALDQLTRDEEVRGSRAYRGLGSGVDDNYPYLVPAGGEERQQGRSVPGAYPVEDQRGAAAFQRPAVPQDWRAEHPAPLRVGTPAAAATTAAAAGAAAYEAQQYRDEQKARFDDQPPPRNPQRLSSYGPALLSSPQQQQEREFNDEASLHHASAQLPNPASRAQSTDGHDTRFLPVSNSDARHPPLTFVPGILRPLALALFLLVLLAYTACLLFCAIYSLLHPGLVDYGTFGDGRYFVFEYLPTLLGLLLFLWVVQLEVALYRIAPFIALSSISPLERARGAHLPLVPRGFVLPYFGHWRAKQGVVGFFLFVAWLQAWTIPLLASGFNVYFFGDAATGRWRWIATQGPLWAAIALYLLLAVAIVLLMLWLKFGRRVTGLKWDPRSLADLVVLLERSNALDDGTAEEVVNGREPPRLGYWRCNARPQEIFHAYGISGREGRRYSVEGGRIREKAPEPAPQQMQMQMPISRFSTGPEDEAGEQRHSREKMLPKRASDASSSDNNNNGSTSSSSTGGALPWFLAPLWASLWLITAIVLLLAFLIVSYLPATHLLRTGFLPLVPAPVTLLGFSSTNFLYSFLPALLGTLLFLSWLSIDYTHRRLAPLAALAHPSGALAEHSLLLSYPAEPPVSISFIALVNGHTQVAFLSAASLLLAAPLPVLAGGVFWAQFYIAEQRTRISVDAPGFIALSVFVAGYVLAYAAIFPSRRLRWACRQSQQLEGGDGGETFTGVVRWVREARLLDDVAFHAPASKIDLVTRLLSAPPGAASRGKVGGGGGLVLQREEGMASKMSVAADSVRGFGRARQQAVVGGAVGEVVRYGVGRHAGRRGEEFWGVDRV